MHNFKSPMIQKRNCDIIVKYMSKKSGAESADRCHRLFDDSVNAILFLSYNIIILSMSNNIDLLSYVTVRNKHLFI